ncbi:peroxide stress protein YaaA [Hydromonas duriensis]|uniref:UPF0246 protein DFR44_10110 n=1 Tax=Hydromonas duriensis TaxID=1527608 RepID=A0A4R6YBI7_9BURK|nr:peroxide stress protein YaaA [Hydromonas duriensis]TDR32961.1 hypothetical protein DFR44_10110 [Hydromonas duriensis]
MLIVLSPAKSLDFETPPHVHTATQPQFVRQSSELMDVLRTYDVPALAQLMHLSDKLAALNVARNIEWQPTFDEATAKQAILAFNGDVYEGFAAAHLSEAQLLEAQKTIRILSGLYGLLRPLDLMRAYRLEMGTALANKKGANLYAFWGETLAQHLNAELSEQPLASRYLINLASDEYFKAVPLTSLNAPVIQPVFQDRKNGQYKIISFFAKRARGVMARWAVTHQVQSPDDLKSFSEEGYRFESEKTAKNGVTQLLFVRDER